MAKGVPNKRYTAEFKMTVVEAVIKGGMSYKEAEQYFEVTGHTCIPRWERIYLIEGAEGFKIERRGRSGTGRSREVSKAVEEDLLSEVQRLRAEVAYLKNLQALVLKNEQHQRKKRR